MVKLFPGLAFPRAQEPQLGALSATPACTSEPSISSWSYGKGNSRNFVVFVCELSDCLEFFLGLGRLLFAFAFAFAFAFFFRKEEVRHLASCETPESCIRAPGLESMMAQAVRSRPPTHVRDLHGFPAPSLSLGSCRHWRANQLVS